MTGSGRLRDEARGERWEQSLVGVTGAVRRRDAAVRTQSPHPGPCRRPAPDSNRLHGQRQVRRRLTAPVVVPSVVLGLGLAGCTAAFALAPAATEPVALVCPAPVTVTWVDQYRDVLGLRVPDPGTASRCRLPPARRSW
nr:hypothetical protein GCM10025730_53810 [Promicromonospora thailandica]